MASRFLLLSGGLALAAPALVLAQAKPAAVPARPVAFAKCAGCHNLVKGGPNGVGPNLYGVVGRKAGSAAGYPYSPALKKIGVPWSRQALDRYIADPGTVVPGGKMPPVSTTPVERQAIIAYLTALK